MDTVWNIFRRSAMPKRNTSQPTGNKKKKITQPGTGNLRLALVMWMRINVWKNIRSLAGLTQSLTSMLKNCSKGYATYNKAILGL